MTSDELKQLTSQVLDQDGCAATFYFMLDTANGPMIRLFDLEESAQDELQMQFKVSVNDALQADDISVLEISSADDRKNVIYRYDLAQIPNELSLIKGFNPLVARDRFDPRTDSIDNIIAIVIAIGTGDNHLVLYKHQYPVSLYKSDGLFALLLGGDTSRFSKFKGELIRVNSKFEFMSLNNEIFIFDISALERFYKFHEAIRNVAIQGVQKITDKGIISDITPLTSRIDDNTFARKLAKIANDSFVLQNIPNSMIIEFTKSHPALQKKFGYNADQTQLILKTKKSQNLFVKLLNDDFLRSDLTKRYYESLAKDPVEN